MQFNPKDPKNKEIVKELVEDAEPREKYFQSIKKHMATKEVYNLVMEK